MPNFAIYTYIQYNENRHKCQEQDDCHKGFSCGTIFKDNQLFQSEPWSLEIELSADEFEICNPLGSKSGIHN